MEIRKLPRDVISRISAGEVITRPYSILKETIENSLDANATHIVVRIELDGLSLTIEDNGDGIHEEDFGLLCKQYCTSKLCKEEDLFSLSSYGFRGEALSSISRCSRIKVKSKRKESEIGYEAVYRDTEMVAMKGIGMRDGTVVEIKSIFYNNKAREKHFSKKREEVREMMWLVGIFSVFNENTSFDLFYGEKLQELPKARSNPHHDGRSNGDKARQKVKMLNELYKANDGLLFEFNGDHLIIFSTPQFNLKKGAFILFVNGRLVVSHEMKEALFKAYKDLIPPDRRPFIYIELSVEKSTVDVNVHPSKREVLFANEESVTQELFKCISNRLCGMEYKQKTLKPLLSEVKFQSPIKVYSDPGSQSIAECLEKDRKEKREFRLLSLKRLKSELVDVDTAFFRSLNYVGIKDRDTILVQHGSSLLNCKTVPLLKEYLYQSLVNDFGNFEKKRTLIPLQSRIEDKIKALLDDYFSIEIVGENIVGIPVISTICVDTPEIWSKFDVKKSLEYETLESIIDTLSTLYSSAEMSLKLFNIVKRRIVGTPSALECFGLITTLKELYRNFERC
ncbi:putative DNA mismatch repair protein [Encephalitozoon hellem ATCC 50504]|uniref:DNA mismatch repair protein Mlh1 n=1 Tax=Encephalitozoon hellem TaxID=27973 RepID=A0A9Q9C5X2_ENCHE|nr:putative DNA mismatch repair protein [Encephalitozoon hellem ATCC 50504]AFM98245.1 putative DNA mismatch repair protein [Encephalitozoon hellem ATCC 50504]UTX43122.1 DNA mismatch repair protein Mlh1 [Encephalitozoon hellem]WEL38579.1 DNA mismatch repair protein Mlh1 [Encephalitozoon hellem]|eukprot:XP_003887226.1 putative DNA mismatch repair protein [Encephalitozoon hellem ATCC 50504]